MKKKILIGSMQVNNGFSGQYYLPYSIGLLCTYVKKHSNKANNLEFAMPIYRREEKNDLVNQLNGVDILLVSLYVWNKNISIAVAKDLKKINPNLLVVFGGPSVPNDASEFMLEHDFIDVCVHQEGEQTFLDIVNKFPDSGFNDIQGINYGDIEGLSYRNKKNIISNTGIRNRIKDFSLIPSPYLDGFFDELIEFVGDSHTWLASWESNRGCPFACTYCDWGSATNSKVTRIELERAFEELDWFALHKIEFIFVCDANFGMLHRDLEIAEYVTTLNKVFGYPRVFSVQNTKNKRERAYGVQKKLADSGLAKAVTIALQSTSKEALVAIKRDNISLDDYFYLQSEFRKDGIPTYTEMIIGLPEETYDSFSMGISDIIINGQHNKIQFNNLSILPNAEMGSKEYLEAYKIKTVACPIVNMHGALEVEPLDKIKETQELVISTSSCDLADWKKTRIFASLIEFLYFSKVLQIPLLYVNVELGYSYKKLIELFIENRSEHKIIDEVLRYFEDHADSITEGGAEFILSKEWGGVYWPPGEYAYLSLVNDNKLGDLYSASNDILQSLTKSEEEKNILSDAIKYNAFKISRPEVEKQTINLNYPIDDFYAEWLYNKIPNKEKSNFEFVLDDVSNYKTFFDWAQKVVWYGHRTGAYLYGDIRMEKDIAGHY
jgi:radical SAM superfamily enzyme YgiQ (UPF0313 family)